MEDSIIRLVCVVAVGWGITFGLRCLPFALFAGRGRDIPEWVDKLGAIVSPVIIAGLVVYSYSGLAWRTAWPYLAGALTVGLQLALRNGLVSIVSGTALYMALLAFAGCASQQTLDLDARSPSVSVGVDGVRLGDRRTSPEEVVSMLRKADIPKDRVVHIHLDGDVRDLSEARRLMSLLCASGYSRPVLVTARHNYGESRYVEISVKADGVWVGSEKTPPERVPSILEARKASKTELVNVFLEDPGRERLAEEVKRIVKGAGFRYVDIVSKHYADSRVFRMTKEGLMYGPRLIDVEDAPALLAEDGAGKRDRFRIFVDPDCTDREQLKVVKRLLDLLARNGCKNVEKMWTPAASKTEGSATSSSSRGSSATASPRPGSSGKIRYKRADE